MKIVIAGGGISGLAARYYLSKQHPDAEIVLLEKSDRLGGCIESSHAPTFFERGPRTFKASRCAALLKLIDELDLSDALIFSAKQARRRYLWKEGKLRAITPFSSLMCPMIFPLLKEWRQPPSYEDDETIASFATRRFGKDIADTFFDPLTLGIFGGEIHKLSISACFPELKKMEAEYGSVTRALFKKKKRKKKQGLFTLKGGLQTLIDRLIEKGRGEIHLNTPLTSLKEERLILALPAPAAQTLFTEDQEASRFFDPLEGKSITAINVAYKKDLLKKKGFGYLVPTLEKEKVLGVIFDSAIFPTQNQESKETRLTVMLKEGGVETALEGIQRHLNIREEPHNIHLKEWKEILPQYTIGHLKRVEAFESHLKKKYPHITCIGNYLYGPSVNQCVELARTGSNHTVAKEGSSEKF